MPISNYIRDKVVELVKEHAGKTDAAIVDIACGDGKILKALKAAGFTNLLGTHYGVDREVYDYSKVDYEDIRVDCNVNVLETLPYGDSAFDIVISTELIEHIESHRHFVGELTRILKPGGLFILETPNIARLSSRLNYLFTGFHKPRNPFLPYDKPLVYHLRYHAFPIHLPTVDYFFHQHGMKLERIVWHERWRWWALFLYVVLLPFIVPILAVFLASQKTLTWPYRKHLFGLMTHPSTLINSVHILTYRKEMTAAEMQARLQAGTGQNR